MENKITLRAIWLYVVHWMWEIIPRINPIARPSVDFLKKIIKEDITVVEIGTLHGFNALAILNTLPVKKIYLVDPYDDYTDNKEFHITGDKILNEAKKRLKKYMGKIVFIRKYSENAIDDIKEKVDFVYIDGNHDYEYVKKDIELYYKKIKSGGILAGHDFDTGSLGVCKAVIEFSEKNNLKLEVNEADWWFIKP